LKELKNVGISTGGVAEVFDNNNGFGEVSSLLCFNVML
jgi:hypothetical protein